MKKIFLYILFFCSLATQAQTLYSDDFESGTTAWNVDGELNTTAYPGTGSSTISTDQARSGTHSLKMTATHGLNSTGQTNNFRYAEPRYNDDITITMWLYFPEKIDLYTFPTADNAFTNLFQWKGVSADNSINDPLWSFGLSVIGGVGSGGDNYLTMKYQGGQWPELGLPASTKTPLVANHAIPVAQWVKFTVRYLKDPSNGHIEVWQDDVKIYDEDNILTDPSEGSPTINRMQFSVNNYGESTIPDTYDIFLDDFQIDLTEQPTDSIIVRGRRASVQ